MASKTADLQSDVANAEGSDAEAQEFIARLEEFAKSLPEREQAILSQMVVETIGEEPQEGGPASTAEPTDEEMESLAEKLDSFHDELPGNQHLYVDDILAASWFKDRADVQGYTWGTLAWRGLVPNTHRGWYAQQCLSRPGAQEFQWKPKRRGGGHTYVACIDLY